MTDQHALGDQQPAPWRRAAMRLEWLPDDLAICRMEASAAVPGWAMRPGFACILRTDAELSIVAPVSALPPEHGPEHGDLKVEGPWRAARVAGKLPFNLTGVVAGLTQPLASAGIPVFVLSTFDTDYVLVRSERAAEAARAWTGAGFEFVGATGSR